MIIRQVSTIKKQQSCKIGWKLAMMFIKSNVNAELAGKSPIYR
jgi:hypothetical protein